MNFYAKLLAAFIVLFAATNIASADSYTTDAQGRKYLVPSEGSLAGKKLMELSASNLNGTYAIRSKKDPNFRFDVDNGTDADGTNVQIYKGSQTYTITHVKDGYYKITWGGSGRCLDIKGNPGTVANGNDIHLWSWTNGDNQLWKFIKNDDGSFTIATKKKGSDDKIYVLDVTGGTMADKTNLQLYQSNNSDAQKWLLEPVSTVASERTVPDYYFERYLVENGWAKIYNEDTHEITGTCHNADYGRADAGYREHVVIVDPENITDFKTTCSQALGEYGKYWTNESATSYKKHFEGVTDLKGVEYFTGLKKLDMSRHIPGDDLTNYGSNYGRMQPGKINLQYNTELEYLSFNYANLNENTIGQTSIYSLSKLKYLNLSNNYFHSFDMRHFPQLQRLQMAHNFSLKRIDADDNDNLEELAIFDSVYGYDSNYTLQKLVDHFKNLVFLHAFSTLTYDLDLTKHHKLQSVWLLKSKYGSSSDVVSNGKYMIYCFGDNTRGLDCAGGAAANGTNIRIWTTSKTSPHHIFQITKESDGYYSIKPTHNTTYAINGNLKDGALVSGNNVTLWTGLGDNSKWKFIKNNDGSYQIESKMNSNLVLDINGGKFENGTNVQVYTKNSSAAQKWVLVPMEMAVNSRQEAKGTFLHKLDLSGCTELRDVHVQNQHLASLNINSNYINQELTEPYKSWQVCREVSTNSTAEGGVSTHAVEVDNNYRHINADLAMWEDNGKYYWMYYLRTAWTGVSEDEPQLNDKTGFYEILSYDHYEGEDYNNANNKSSRKQVELSNTLADDCFDAARVISAKTSTEINNINSNGLIQHTAGDGKLCIISNFDGQASYQNADVLPSAFRSAINGNVHGSLIVLKAGVSDSNTPAMPSDLPQSICYDYDMLTTNARASLPGTFFFDIHYPTLRMDMVTGVNEAQLDANKEIASVKYYNLLGVENVIPFKGVNIMVTTYTDGTHTSTKIVK